MFFHTFRKPDSLLPPYTLSEPHFHPLVALCPPQLCICGYFTTVCHSVSWGSYSPVFLNIEYGACHLADAQRTLSMYSCESWTVKEADCQRIDAFELWCWRRLLKVPWTARRSDQLILKEINPEYSLEGLMLKLKLQYFGHLMQTADSLQKTLMLGKTEGRRGWDGWMASLMQWAWTWANSGRWWGRERLACHSPWGCKEWGMTGQLNSYTKNVNWPKKGFVGGPSI